MAQTRIALRDVENDDVAGFFEHQLDPQATAMAGFPSRDREAHDAHWAGIRCSGFRSASTERTELAKPGGTTVAAMGALGSVSAFLTPATKATQDGQMG